MSTFFRLLSLNAARLLFVGSLLLALYVGLVWAFSPEDRPDAEAIAAVEAARDAQASELAEQASATPTPTPTPVGTPVVLEPTESPAQLIAEAAAPGETRIQVLDAGGGGAAVDEAIAALESIGYQVVAVSSSRRKVTATTVYFVEGNEAEARALRARDPRFQAVEPNQGLNANVELHVLVGPAF